MSDKGLLASICGFFKGLFSSDKSCCDDKPATTQSKSNDGLTGVERYIRNNAQSGSQLTGVEKYIRKQLADNKPLTGVESYIRNQVGAKPLTGVERYIRSKS